MNVLGRVKILQYCGNLELISSAFCKSLEDDGPHWIVRYRTHLILSACYSPDLPLCHETQSRNPRFYADSPWLIKEVRLKFLELSGNRTMIKCDFIFSIMHGFGCFRGVMDQFELVEQKFPEQTILLNVHLSDFQSTHGMKQYTTRQRINYLDNNNHSVKPLWLDLLYSRGIHAANLAHTKMLQNV